MANTPEPQRLNEVVAGNIRDVLYDKRLSQAKLATILGRSRPWLSERMTGKYAFRTDDIDKIAAATGVSTARLIRPLGK